MISGFSNFSVITFLNLGWNWHPFWSRRGFWAGLGAGPLAPTTDTTAFLIPLLAPTTSSSDFFSSPQAWLSLLTLTTLGAGGVPENFTSPTMDPPPWAPTWEVPPRTAAARARQHSTDSHWRIVLLLIPRGSCAGRPGRPATRAPP